MTRRALALPAGLIALAFVAWALPLQHAAFWVHRDNVGDVRIYAQYAREMAKGLVPYRDFRVEYPPGATFIFWLVWQVPGEYRAALSGARRIASPGCFAWNRTSIPSSGCNRITSRFGSHSSSIDRGNDWCGTG